MKDKINRSYMQDMFPEIARIENAHYVNSNRFEGRSVDGHSYIDPDTHCRRLYEDEIRFFFDANGAKTLLRDDGKQYIIEHTIPGCEEPVRLTSDYLGPSATAAFHAGLDDDFVWDVLVRCRTIGGHLLWPRLSDSINQKKANSGNYKSGISDRTDVALYELKNYLAKDNNAACLNTGIRNAFENPVNDTWLRGFDPSGERPFEAFCDFFRLKRSFVDDNYNIIWLAPKTMGKASKEDVMSFFRENTAAVERRNMILSGGEAQ